MRPVADSERILGFMNALGRRARERASVYFTGGATAVLQGWRASTIDVDIEIVPDSEAILRELPALKEELDINVELVSPAHFIPELPGWRERSPWITDQGTLSFHHYDFYSQALAKLERGHVHDLEDVREMVMRKLVEPARARELYDAIEPDLFRYPAVSPKAFRRAVETAFAPPR
jgi:hypothetical protein